MKKKSQNSPSGVCNDEFYIMLLENDQLENLHLTIQEMEQDVNLDEKQKQRSYLGKPTSISEVSREAFTINRVIETLRNIKKDNSVGKRKMAQCEICFKILKDKYNLSNHIDTIHKKIRQHKCIKCSAAFANTSNLISHINYIHKEDRPYKCTNCSKSFVNRAEAKKHYNAVHANLRPHKCDICDKLFNHMSSLRRHNECVHENLRLFKCPKCSADYKDRNGLKKHLISYHVNGISMRKRKDKSLPSHSLYNNTNNLKYHMPESLSIYILDNSRS